MPNMKTQSVQTSSTTDVTGKANLVKVLFFLVWSHVLWKYWQCYEDYLSEHIQCSDSLTSSPCQF